MSVALQVNVRDNASPALQRFLDRLQNRRGLNLLVGQRVQNKIRDHLIGLV
jgi:hypothetical protein